MLAMHTRVHKIIYDEPQDQLLELMPGQLAQRVIDYLIETYVRPEQEQSGRQTIDA